MKNFMKRISSTETLNSNAKNNSAHPHNNELLGKTIQVEGKKFRLVEVLSSSGASAVVYKAKFVEASSSTTSSSSLLCTAPRIIIIIMQTKERTFIAR